MNTPETAALVAADLHLLEDDDVPATAYWRMVELARELEQERNRLHDLIKNSPCNPTSNT